ncbi:hypothetical protein AOLI_G00027580 [Acnodon oligacanthus]
MECAVGKGSEGRTEGRPASLLCSSCGAFTGILSPGAVVPARDAEGEAPVFVQLTLRAAAAELKLPFCLLSWREKVQSRGIKQRRASRCWAALCSGEGRAMSRVPTRGLFSHVEDHCWRSEVVGPWRSSNQTREDARRFPLAEARVAEGLLGYLLKPHLVT